MIGVVFSLVIVRAGMGLGKQHLSTVQINASNGAAQHSQNSGAPLALNIKQQTDTVRTADQVITIEKTGETVYNDSYLPMQRTS